MIDFLLSFIETLFSDGNFVREYLVMITEEELQDAGQIINRVIHLSPRYAKFYCTRGRILAGLGRFIFNRGTEKNHQFFKENVQELLQANRNKLNTPEGYGMEL